MFLESVFQITHIRRNYSFSLSNENVFSSSNVNESLDGKPELKAALIKNEKKKKGVLLP